MKRKPKKLRFSFIDVLVPTLTGGSWLAGWIVENRKMFMIIVRNTGEGDYAVTKVLDSVIEEKTHKVLKKFACEGCAREFALNLVAISGERWLCREHPDRKEE